MQQVKSSMFDHGIGCKNSFAIKRPIRAFDQVTLGNGQ